MMEKRYNILGQRGTLLVEAIAMLGLIAIVTPTLYKKSAERMQEIQDINVASQARTMNSIIETFVKSNFDNLLEATSSDTSTTVELNYADNSAIYSSMSGYSAFVPFGYTAGDLKNYGNPRVFVHRDGSSLVSYVVFPATNDPGQKRAARIASLVGANGGMASEPLSSSDAGPVLVYGTGGAWKLSKDMLTDLGVISEEEDLPLNSLVVTASEPISISNIDSEKFLYRVPPEGDGDEYHNTMVTDLYMGGAEDPTAWGPNAEDYYSIWNVRKLTLNTRCTPGVVHGSAAAGSENDCDPNVADLYIGRPTIEPFSTQSSSDAILNKGNTGAAWIYGNLSALKERFSVFRERYVDTSGVIEEYDVARNPGNYDVLEFSRRDDIGDSSEVGPVELSVLRAQNKYDEAKVGMIDEFVVAREGSSGTDRAFLVGNSSSIGGEGGLVYAGYSSAAGMNVLRLNAPDGIGDSHSFDTVINSRGGTVYIGGTDGSSSSESGGAYSEVFINNAGGKLEAGEGGNWMYASGGSSDAQVHMLRNPGASGVFTVGSSDASRYSAKMDSSRIALSDGRFLLYDRIHSGFGMTGNPSENISNLQIATGHDDTTSLALVSQGAMVLRPSHLDVWGNMLLANEEVTAPDPTDPGLHNEYRRRLWKLTVGGSTYIDGLLWAKNAWFNKSGFKELHAGYSSYSDYSSDVNNGWLHATGSSVTMTNKFASGTDRVMFEAKDSSITMSDLNGAKLRLASGEGARMGYTSGSNENFFYAGPDEGAASSSVRMVGYDRAKIYTTDSSTIGVVDIQQGGLQLKGSPETGSSYGNAIIAKAGEFGIKTARPSEVDRMQFQVNEQEIATRDVDFRIMNNKSEGEDIEKTVFLVKPNSDNSSNANVQVRGTLHVNNNDILHISSNEHNTASDESGDDRHAMLEIDPNYIQVWSRENSSSLYSHEGRESSNAYYAMLRIDPGNVSGESSSEAGYASVYIRKGAIELEKSMPSGESSSVYLADTGYGYIMANRFVSNAEQEVPGTIAHVGDTGSTNYDQYMVNPAYTSVMHDIKLTTRGGARLSDILPDYVLKGVYNLINNYEEGGASDPTSQVEGMSSWADPYIGIIPYASCPPGYHQLATIVPISFNVGQAGDIIVEGAGANKRFRVNPAGRQAKVLQAASDTERDEIAYPNFEPVSSFVVNSLVGEWSSSSFVPTSSNTQWRTEGWFVGLPAIHSDSDWATTHSRLTGGSSTAFKYERDSSVAEDRGFMAVAEPLYFQQNTWLKTSVVPGGSSVGGWRAYMGFLYDASSWAGVNGGISRENSIVSNANDSGSNESSVAAYYSGFVWNLFPVPTNTLEGHATVYCYFDRSKFREGGWSNLVDQIDQLGAIRNSMEGFRYSGDKGGESSDYVKRLNDPSLKYDDPW